MPLEPFRMKVIEVVTAEFLIHATFALKVIADDQQAMSYSDERSFTPSSSGEPFELGGEVTVLRSYCCPRGLTCHTAQPWTAISTLAAEPFACALMVAWT
jgi:hypothetical protein